MEEARERVLRLLRRAGVRPSKRLGQHFLVHPRGPEVFLRGLRGPWGQALEIGPGPGSITFPASRVVPRIVAVELDPRLAEALAEEAPPGVQVVLGDGVRILSSWRGGLVYSNTPFHLSGEIVEAAARNNFVEVAVLGVQREVARRIAAPPGTAEYGRLSVTAQLVFVVESLGVIPPSWYTPRPEVYTEVVRLVRVRRWGSWADAAAELARCAFTSRNKRAVKVLSRCLGVPKSRVEACGVDPHSRVRDLEPWLFARLAASCRR